MNAEDWSTALILGGMILLILLMIEPIRKHLLELITFLLSSVTEKIWVFLIYSVKTILASHLTWMKHLLTPHSVIFKKLEAEVIEEERAQG